MPMSSIALVVILAAGAALQIASNAGTPADPPRPQPIGDPATWVRAEDYPAEALRAGQEGAVRLALTIGTDGVPKACRIEESSGSAVLDQGSCAVLMARARFAPMGQETVFTRSIRWAIPKAAEGNLDLGVTIRAEGQGFACDTEIAGKPRKLTPETCAALVDGMRRAGREPAGTTRVEVPNTPKFVQPEG
jgi:TonB family protein